MSQIIGIDGCVCLNGAGTVANRLGEGKLELNFISYKKLQLDIRSKSENESIQGIFLLPLNLAF